LPQNYSVDIWFVFGSFVYGFEGSIVSWENALLEVVLTVGQGAEAQGMFDFLSELSQSPKGFLKSEIRLYEGSGSQEKPLVSLVTEVVPQATVQMPQPRVVFSNLHGISQDDIGMWEKISPKL
jgi:hypothetical protein